MPTPTLTGTIYTQYDEPLANARIVAREKKLRREEFLGETITDEHGKYTLPLTGATPAIETGPLDVFIEVYSNDRPAPELLGRSPIYYQVAGKMVLDYKVGGGAPRGIAGFDRVLKTIRPIVQLQELKIAELKEDEENSDLTHLAGHTGQGKEQLSALVKAHQLSETTTGQQYIDPAVFYALSRVGYPEDLNALSLATGESIEKGIAKAVEQNIISSKWLEEIPGIQRKFNQFGKNNILSGQGEANKIISAALPQAARRETFVDTYLANESEPEAFWDRLAEQEGFQDGRAIAGLKHLLRLRGLTDSAAMAALLYREQAADPELSELPGLAKFSQQDWANRITRLLANGKLNHFPDSVRGETAEEKIENYAKALEETVHQLYPTRTFAQRMVQDSETPFDDDLGTFLNNNPDFPLRTDQISKELEGADFDGVSDRAATREAIATVNRLIKLTPLSAGNYQTVKALQQEGIGSATGLVRTYSSAQFMEKMQGVLEPEQAAEVYKRAQRVDKIATALALRVKTGGDIPIYALNGEQSVSPDYQSMFGDNKLCDCAHCRSVYSPAAYLVDLLHFLQQNKEAAFTTLAERRPDIDDILLSCKNTNTTLPYLDLVNEVLEGHITGEIVAHQTGRPAAELAAYPEHVNADAYALLKTANTSFRLPLDLPLEEARMFLEKLQLRRYQLMELFYGKEGDGPYQDVAVAAEYLGLSKQELDLINGVSALPDFSMDRVSDFLQFTGLSYLELLALLDSYLINPPGGDGRAIRIVADINEQNSDPATCDIQFLRFEGITGNTPNTVLRFLRLRKKLNWSICDLDRFFTALRISDLNLTPAEINAGLIVPLSQVVRLQDRLGLTVPELLTFWSTLDVQPYWDYAKEEQPRLPTLYESLFQNKMVSDPVDPDLADPGALSGNLADKANVITAALHMSESELALLIRPPITNGELSLENLSILFRYARLSKAVKIPLADLTGLINLLGVTVFEDPHSTLMFMDKLQLLRSGRIGLDELQALLRNQAVELNTSLLNKMAGDLNAIREGLQQIELRFPDADGDDQQADAKRQNQGQFLADSFSGIFQTDSAMADVLLNELVRFPAGPAQPAIFPFLYQGFIQSEGPVFVIADNGSIAGFTDVVNTYLALYGHWTRLQVLIKRLQLSSGEVIYLYRNAAALQLDDLWEVPAEALPFAPFEKLMQLVRFRDALPKPVPEDWYALFDPILNDTEDGKQQFITALAERTGAAVSSLEFLLGPGADVNATGSLQFRFPDDYLDGTSLQQVINCLKTAEQYGGSVENLRQLTPQEIGPAEARLAQSMLRSKYDENTWLEIVRPVSDHFRSRKRAALVAYILTTDPQAFPTENALFEHFLIDTQMAPCMMTSRIKQAVSSVQLFMDRCLMGLEAGLTFAPDLSRQWEQWRKWYRIWEANRKVFLYPENWIEPELRDDKSPFFKDLESRLLQNEVTDEVVTEALQEYLRKLDEVANLEIIGLFPDELTGIVHVLGRTKAIPHHYFYRKRENQVWTAWEKVELDIEGNHVLLRVWNNRLMLFWLKFQEKQEQKEEGLTLNIPPRDEGGKITADKALKYLEIQLIWSEYKDNHWAPKKISEQSVTNLWEGKIKKPVKKQAITLISGLEDRKLWVGLFVPNRSGTNTKVPGTLGQKPTYQSDSEDIEVPYKTLAAFVFNNCTDAPSVADKEITLVKSLNLGDENMFQVERKQDQFALLKTGMVFHPEHRNPGSEILFYNTPGEFRILFNHDRIEQEKPAVFFYSNAQHNFFAYSTDNLLPEFSGGDLVTETGSLLKRNTYRPNSYALSLAAENSSEVTDLSAVTDSNTTSGGQANTGMGSSSATALSRAVDLSEPTNALDLQNKSSLPPLKIMVRKQYTFQTFYHPYVCEYIKALNTEGIDGLYDDNMQNQADHPLFARGQDYYPTSAVIRPWPVENVDFSYSGTYSLYNWELFFHIPLLIATRLTQNQKFAEARKWFHYIFDPTKSSVAGDAGAERFWIVKPFKKAIRDGLLNIAAVLANEEDRIELDNQIKNWANNPFNPHAVARLRIAAYLRTTVMKYIDNLVAWGDQLFRRDTIESINEATQLYILTANLLGQKPPAIPPRAQAGVQSFSTLLQEATLDGFSNAKVVIESFLSHSDYDADALGDGPLRTPMFCIPKNDQLLGYWDTLADRLFKIRNCMNIEGQVRQLPLFEPPIDPALLVRATAMGLDVSTVLDNVYAPLPNYRFQVILQKAREFCNDVQALGNQLLSLLEKRDAEGLSLLRSGQEIKLLESIRDLKIKQRDEAKENLDAVIRSRLISEEKKSYYSSRPLKNAREKQQLDDLDLASLFQDIQGGNENVASVLFGVPEVKIGAWSWGTETGGKHFAGVSKSIGALFGALANHYVSRANIAGIEGSYLRRMDDWIHQANIATGELQQIEKQIAAAEIRLAIAEKELDNHNLQIENAKETDNYLRSKFTNQELYSHMVGQVSSIYFQSYQMAYEMAKKAEKCYRYELGIENTAFVKFGHWDSLKKGLLSGEKLMYDLRRLETAYLENNKREYELTKSVSVAAIDPLALIELKQQGFCTLQLPEVIFDLDYPGQYMRRIKSVSLTIPCITGPYTNVSCQLRLLSNRIRKSTGLEPQYRYESAEDSRFLESFAATTSVATSSGQNDSGLFVLDFRDERYLPFEGAGVISGWQIELPAEFRQFDYDTISDIIFQIRYTARDGGAALKSAAIAEIDDILQGAMEAEGSLRTLFSARHDFSSAWHRFFHPAEGGTTQVLELDLNKKRFPFLLSGKNIALQQIRCFLKLKEGIVYVDTAANRLAFDLIRENGPEFSDIEFSPTGSAVAGIPQAVPFADSDQELGLWRIEIAESRLTDLPESLTKTIVIDGVEHLRLSEEAIEDIYLVINYVKQE